MRAETLDYFSRFIVPLRQTPSTTTRATP